MKTIFTLLLLINSQVHYLDFETLELCQRARAQLIEVWRASHVHCFERGRV